MSTKRRPDPQFWGAFVRPSTGGAPSLRPLTRALGAATLLVGCSGGGGHASATGTTVDPFASIFDVPVTHLSTEFEKSFNDGDIAFSTPLRDADGLGPLYTRSSCDSCHSSAVRGPGLVQKMSVVEADGVTPAAVDAQTTELPWGHTVHPLTTMGALPILPPGDSADGGAPTQVDAGVGRSVKVSIRVGPPVLGRGYMEAVLDSEIERVEAEQAKRTDGIHGRINHVTYGSQISGDARFHTHVFGDQVIGRFGVKARVATLDDFAADAFQGDMGITSPLRPIEIQNPSGITDDAKPGIDVAVDSVNSRATYTRTIAIPDRNTSADGPALFDKALCSVCHAPSLHTRPDYPIAPLANIDAAVYTDFLLHKMGTELADGLPPNSVDGEAGSFDWRTAPLIGERFDKTYLHDGRAKTVEEAIEMHRGDGSEANVSIDAFDALSTSEKSDLVDFVTAL